MTTPLTTLAAVQAYCGLSDTTTAALIPALITAVSAAIETYCSRTFGQATYNETRNGANTDRIMPINRPCTAVTSVTVDGVTIPQAPDNVSFGWVLDPVSSLIYIRVGYKLTPPPPVGNQQGGIPINFSRGIQNVVLVYTACFAPLPADVAQAANSWIGYLIAKRQRLDKKSEVMPQGQSQGWDLSAMPEFVKAVIDTYRYTMVPG